MEKCDFNIIADIAADCESMSVKGIANNGYIINYADIDKTASSFDLNDPSVLKTLVLKSGKKAYRCYVPGKTPFTGTNKSLVVGTYVNTWTKQVKLVILNEGPDVANAIVNKLANGQFVVILENKTRGAGGKATYEVFGFETGLSATEMVNDKYSEETNGGYSCTLEESGATKCGVFLYASDIETTQGVLESLLTGS